MAQYSFENTLIRVLMIQYCVKNKITTDCIQNQINMQTPR